MSDLILVNGTDKLKKWLTDDTKWCVPKANFITFHKRRIIEKKEDWRFVYGSAK